MRKLSIGKKHARIPPGAIVLSSELECQNCKMIQRFGGIYMLYQAK